MSRAPPTVLGSFFKPLFSVSHKKKRMQVFLQTFF